MYAGFINAHCIGCWPSYKGNYVRARCTIDTVRHKHWLSLYKVCCFTMSLCGYIGFLSVQTNCKYKMRKTPAVLQRLIFNCACVKSRHRDIDTELGEVWLIALLVWSVYRLCECTNCNRYTVRHSLVVYMVCLLYVWSCDEYAYWKRLRLTDFRIALSSC